MCINDCILTNRLQVVIIVFFIGTCTCRTSEPYLAFPRAVLNYMCIKRSSTVDS